MPGVFLSLAAPVSIPWILPLVIQSWLAKTDPPRARFHLWCFRDYGGRFDTIFQNTLFGSSGSFVLLGK